MFGRGNSSREQAIETAAATIEGHHYNPDTFSKQDVQRSVQEAKRKGANDQEILRAVAELPYR